jgi:hypothetical protein
MTRADLWRLATLAAAGLGVASAASFVGPEALVARSPALPLAHDDFALQFYYGQLGAELWRETGLPYGFDPSFLAGYAKNPLYYPSSGIFELALALFAHADPVLVFDRCAFVLLAIAPLCAWAAAAAFGLTPGAQLAATALAVVPQRLAPSADYAPFLEASGMLPFVFAASLALLALGWIARASQRRSARDAALLAAVATLLVIAHPTSLILIAAPAAVAYAAAARALGSRGHLALAAAALPPAAALLPIAVGFARYGATADLGDFYTPGGREHFAPPGGWLAPLRASSPDPVWLSALPLVAGALGLWFWWREQRRLLAAILGAQLVALGGLAYYGAPLGLSALGPARFTLPLAQALLLPAAHALARIGSSGARWLRSSHALAQRPNATRAAALAAAAGLIGVGLASRVWLRSAQIPALERASGFRAHAAGLLAFLRERVDPRTRLLHEETDREQHRYYGSHLAALFPGATGALLAGGPAPHALVRENALRFIGGTLAGMPLYDLGDPELRAQLDRYNVGQILCWSRIAQARFAAIPWLDFEASYDRFRLYRVRDPAGWFARGAGELERVGRRLHLRGVEGEDGAAVLRFHYQPTLRSRPPRALGPQPIEGSGLAFIRIDDPPAELWIGEEP